MWHCSFEHPDAISHSFSQMVQVRKHCTLISTLYNIICEPFYFKLFLQLCLSCTSDYCLKRSNLDQFASECGGSRKPFSSETESPWCPLLLCSREKSRGKPVSVSSAVSTSTPVSNTPPPTKQDCANICPHNSRDLPAIKDAKQGKCGGWSVRAQPQGP